MAALTEIDAARVSPRKAPTPKQIYAIAHLALETLGRDWPESRREASELITELQVEPLVRALEGEPSAWVNAG